MMKYAHWYLFALTVIGLSLWVGVKLTEMVWMGTR